MNLSVEFTSRNACRQSRRRRCLGRHRCHLPKQTHRPRDPMRDEDSTNDRVGVNSTCCMRHHQSGTTGGTRYAVAVIDHTRYAGLSTKAAIRTRLTTRSQRHGRPSRSPSKAPAQVRLHGTFRSETPYKSACTAPSCRTTPRKSACTATFEPNQPSGGRDSCQDVASW